MKATVKIVDTFNGGEHGKFATEDQAEAVLETQRKEFYSVPGSQNNYFKRAIVTVDKEWSFNHRTNQWEWS